MPQAPSLLQRRRGFGAPLAALTKMDPWHLSTSIEEHSKHPIASLQSGRENPCVGVPNRGLGAYKTIEKLAHGTAGVVYRAERLSDKQDVAVKFVRTTDEELIENARQEFDILKSLEHPWIVKAFDFIVTPMGSALVMDYFPGCNLKTAVRRAPSGHFEESIAQAIFLKLADALDYVHRRGIIHRDIKPQNVLVSSDFDDVRLIDFNVAGRASDGLLTVTGTLSFMSPEVLLGCSPSAAGDIWALGLCLHLMLCGKLILDCQGFNSRYEYGHELRSMTLPADFASKISKDISCECKELLHQCLRADPGTRATAHQLLAGNWTKTNDS